MTVSSSRPKSAGGRTRLPSGHEDRSADGARIEARKAPRGGALGLVSPSPDLLVGWIPRFSSKVADFNPPHLHLSPRVTDRRTHDDGIYRASISSWVKIAKFYWLTGSRRPTCINVQNFVKIGCIEIAIHRCFKMAVFCHPIFLNFDFLTCMVRRIVVHRISKPNFVKIGQTVCEIICFFIFKMAGQPTSSILKTRSI